MQTLLFQGDSITDVGRNREQAFDLGKGYPMLAAAQLMFEKPEAYIVYNRGISGDRIVDVYARIKRDILNLRPDVLSVLIGINDVWHEIGSKNGVEAEKFERIYDMLLEEVQRALPNIRVMLLEPFVLKGTATIAAFETFEKETRLRAEAVRRLAEKHAAVFVPLQAAFDEKAKQTGAEIWAADGVHPTLIGHELIKREWIKAFE
jgi:Lysophospholipase L1 and related esterases